uniref:Putative secreted protein n=1 Tax=Anopheles triannulatus TaxID=58253 RepID=A0A2M4B148_9DIPT
MVVVVAAVAAAAVVTVATRQSRPPPRLHQRYHPPHHRPHLQLDQNHPHVSSPLDAFPYARAADPSGRIGKDIVCICKPAKTRQASRLRLLSVMIPGASPYHQRVTLVADSPHLDPLPSSFWFQCFPWPPVPPPASFLPCPVPILSHLAKQRPPLIHHPHRPQRHHRYDDVALAPPIANLPCFPLRYHRRHDRFARPQLQPQLPSVRLPCAYRRAVAAPPGRQTPLSTRDKCKQARCSVRSISRDASLACAHSGHFRAQTMPNRRYTRVLAPALRPFPHRHHHRCRPPVPPGHAFATNAPRTGHESRSEDCKPCTGATVRRLLRQPSMESPERASVSYGSCRLHGLGSECCKCCSADRDWHRWFHLSPPLPHRTGPACPCDASANGVGRWSADRTPANSADTRDHGFAGPCALP